MPNLHASKLIYNVLFCLGSLLIMSLGLAAVVFFCRCNKFFLFASKEKKRKVILHAPKFNNGLFSKFHLEIFSFFFFAHAIKVAHVYMPLTSWCNHPWDLVPFFLPLHFFPSNNTWGLQWGCMGYVNELSL